MAANAALAAGASYKKRSSLAFIFAKTKDNKQSNNKVVIKSGGKKCHLDPKSAKAMLPSFYNPNEPPPVVVSNDDEDDETSIHNKNREHNALSLQASSSSVNSTHRPLMIVVDNAVVTSDLSLSDSYNQQQTSKTAFSKKQQQRLKRRRASSWKEPGPLTRAIPYMSSTSGAYMCCFVNFILPGFGTLIAAIIAGSRPDLARSEFSPKRTFWWNFLAFSVQFLFAPLLFGWIYGILWGFEVIERAKLMSLAKLGEKQQQLQAEIEDAAEDEMHHHHHQQQQHRDECLLAPPPPPSSRRHRNHSDNRHERPVAEMEPILQVESGTSNNTVINIGDRHEQEQEQLISSNNNNDNNNVVTYRHDLISDLIAKKSRPTSYHEQNPEVLIPAMLIRNKKNNNNNATVDEEQQLPSPPTAAPEHGDDATIIPEHEFDDVYRRYLRPEDAEIAV